MSDPTDGLHQKYVVIRLDGRDQSGGDKAGARYFVLDYVHDPLAQAALEYYAEIARADGQEVLADDLATSLGAVLEGQGAGPGIIMPLDRIRIRQLAREMGNR